MNQRNLWVISKLTVDPSNPRKTLDQESLKDLADNIKRVGIINPIEILKNGQIVTGERRYRAALLAGLRKVPVTIVNPGKEKLFRQFSENVFRQDMSAADLAETILKLQAQGYTLREIDRRSNHSLGWSVKVAAYRHLPKWLQDEFKKKNNNLGTFDIAAFARIIKENKDKPAIVKFFVQNRLNGKMTNANVVQKAYSVYKAAGDLAVLKPLLKEKLSVPKSLALLDKITTPFSEQLRVNLDSGQWLIKSADDFAHAMKNAREKGIAPLHLRRASQSIINVEREYALLKGKMTNLIQ